MVKIEIPTRKPLGKPRWWNGFLCCHITFWGPRGKSICTGYFSLPAPGLDPNLFQALWLSIYNLVARRLTVFFFAALLQTGWQREQSLPSQGCVKRAVVTIKSALACGSGCVALCIHGWWGERIMRLGPWVLEGREYCLTKETGSNQPWLDRWVLNIIIFLLTETSKQVQEDLRRVWKLNGKWQQSLADPFCF